MEAVPCRKDCHFNWEEFETQLYTAMLHLVVEKGICSHEITAADFMEYVLAKLRAQERRVLWEITYEGTDEAENDTEAVAAQEAKERGMRIEEYTKGILRALRTFPEFGKRDHLIDAAWLNIQREMYAHFREILGSVPQYEQDGSVLLKAADIEAKIAELEKPAPRALPYA